MDADRGLGPEFTRHMEDNDYMRERLDDIAPITDPEKFGGKIQRYRRG